MGAKHPHLFLDCDGVLADFDAGAKNLLGMTPAEFEQRRGRGEFWKRLARAPDFYGQLSEMPDAQRLFRAVKHLKPTILHRTSSRQLGGAAKGALGSRAFPGSADHHHHGPQEASAHGSG